MNSLTNFQTSVLVKSVTTASIPHSRSQVLTKLSILTQANVQKIRIQCLCQMLILMALGSTALVSSNEYFIGEDILAKRYSKLLRLVHPIKVSVITR